jgi:flagellar biosynthesis component FlhA
MPGIDPPLLEQNLQQVQVAFLNEFGVIAPLIHLQADNKLPLHTYRLKIDDRMLDTLVGIDNGEFWANLPVDLIEGMVRDSAKDQPDVAELTLSLLQIRESEEPNTGSPAAILHPSQEFEDKLNQKTIDTFRSSGIEVRDQYGYIVFTVAAELRRNIADLLTPSLVEYLLGKLDIYYPALVTAVRENIGISILTEALKTRLSERQSIRNLALILEDLLIEKLARQAQLHPD